MFAAGLLMWATSSARYAPLSVRDLSPLLAIDAAARRLPLGAASTIATVAKGLAAASPSPLAKARAAYVWTTSNVAYDLESRPTPAATLAALSGDCDAHSAIYQALCKAMGVECVTVPGTVRFGIEPDAKLTTISKPLAQGQWLVAHSWNAVRIDGHWGLVDTTYGAKAKEGATDSDDYFLADPTVFASDHVPDDEAMRLSDAPSDLAHTPFLRPAAWRMGLEAADFTTDTQREGAQVVLRPRLAWRRGMRAALQSEAGAAADRVLLQPANGGTEMRLCPTGAASIVWLGLGSGKTWQPIAGYSVVGATSRRFPKVMTRFYDSGATLLGAFDRELTANRPTEIRMRAPGASSVVAFQGPDMAGSFVKEGDEWVLKANPSPGAPFEVMASYADPMKFAGLLTYDVR